MPRRKASGVSLEEAKVRFEEWRQNRRGKADTGRTLGNSGRGGPEGRPEPHLDRVARGVEPSETAHGRGSADIAEICSARIRGTGGVAATIASRMHR